MAVVQHWYPHPAHFLAGSSLVTESKLLLLATWQANKPGDEVLGKGIVTLFGKPADQEDGRLTS